MSPCITTRPMIWIARTTAKTAAASSTERRLKPRYQPIRRAMQAVSAITAADSSYGRLRGYARRMHSRTLDLHIDDLCARHGIRRVDGHGRAVVIRVRHRDGRTERRLEIRAPPGPGPGPHFVALHAIGRPRGAGRSRRRLGNGAAAWPVRP